MGNFCYQLGKLVGKMTTGFADFLKRNTVRPCSALPLVHSTPAHHLRKISKSNTLVASGCDVFTGEKLNYFFVGRPAYKYTSDEGTAAHWQLPVCFIFEFASLSPFKRVFPCDSGAFSRGLYPDYMNVIGMSEFECSDISDAPERIIGAYFGNASAYYALNAKSKPEFASEFSIKTFDDEAAAVHKLAWEETSLKFDDRRLTVEVQIERDVDLVLTKPLAVVMPMPYFSEPSVIDKVEKEWGAQPISYPMFPLSVNAYYALIYERVELFYKSRGLLP